ncbi:TPA: DinB family protein [Elizabethkingia anophelis]|uniref:DinB family protein n=1 Tax=Elizabethkingia anophelis TaxID=1117645 RepID=UPI001626C96D|nr:DinB family protein [Elizabethkingia anophelis]MCT3671709.1 DinB family protein [Elizabethkingia anophelis]MCT3679321.1 DinB family protein [Elizabethkingia anophelis]MCT3703118.1 DinB family protein [Elizabethkingia anophelis]MCT3769375.1 DinB family protein [Elizabethkingia anophelis]MCT3779451.1 DinB family protein [Elizabethkingia anophelis]
MNYQILRPIIDTELKRFETISEDEWSYKASPEKWSRKEILGHLCDSAFTNIRRFVVTQYKENENIVYDQDEWVKAQNYQNIPTAEVINLWKSLNYQIVHIVENIPDEVLQRTCDTSKTTPEILTLEVLIKGYIDHLHHHLKTI